MTATCSCPPGDCHGGHTINVGMPVTSAQFCGYGSCDRPPGHEGPHLCRCSKPVDSPANGCKWHTPGARLTDEQLRQLRDDPLADYHHAGITAMATELLALRARAAELEADQAVANKALDEIAGYVQPDEDGMWTDADGLLESIGNTVESTGRKVWEESHG